MQIAKMQAVQVTETDPALAKAKETGLWKRSRWLKPVAFLLALGCTGTTISTEDPPPASTLVYFFAPPDVETYMSVYPEGRMIADRQSVYDQIGRDPNAAPTDVAFGLWYNFTVGNTYEIEFSDETNRYYFGSLRVEFTGQKLIRVDRGPVTF